MSRLYFTSILFYFFLYFKVTYISYLRRPVVLLLDQCFSKCGAQRRDGWGEMNGRFIYFSMAMLSFIDNIF